MGFTTPRPVRMITDGTRIGTEYERITPKKSFARAISDNPELLEEYTVRFASMCRQLHSTLCNKDLFPSIVQFYSKVVKDNVFFTDEEKTKVLSFIKTVPETGTCCHGDLHIGNVITSNGVDYWIDLSEFAWGNPLFDLGVLYLGAFINTDKTNIDYFHLNTKQMAQVWDVFKREYFSVKSIDESRAIDDTVAPFAALKLIFFSFQNHTDSLLHKDFVYKVLSL